MTEPKQVLDRGSPPATPRWVKVFVTIFIILVSLVITLHLMGFDFGNHGMGGAKLFVSIALKPLSA